LKVSCFSRGAFLGVLSIDKRFVFIHVSKTGGRSLTSVLSATGARFSEVPGLAGVNPGVSTEHLGAQDMADFLGRDWESYYSFGFVRNPWDRVVSIYRFIQETPNAVSHRELAGLSFEEFLLRPRKSEKPRQNWDNLSDRTGERQLVPEIFRFENVTEAYETIARRCGFEPPELPRLNATTRSDYRQYYTPKLAAVVADLFEVDILRFGYRF
jgi:hypothetical protein